MPSPPHGNALSTPCRNTRILGVTATPRRLCDLDVGTVHVFDFDDDTGSVSAIDG
jgi:hypothetical protein